MSIQFLMTHPTPQPRPLGASRLWRRWWLRAAKARQMQHLDRVLHDPHLARDLGLPAIERTPLRTELW